MSRDTTGPERGTMKNWGGRLGAPDQLLTREEAQLLATMVAVDRLLEVLTALQDLQMRVQRLELYAANHLPGYDAETATAVPQLTDGRA